MIIEMFPAENGDAFLLRLDNGVNILIDMGYERTYKKFIKDRLIDLKDEGQCIDLLIITHIDEDHIEGAIEFFKENGHAENPNIIDVKEIWYNSYRHLQFQKSKVCSTSRFEKRKLEEIKLSNYSKSREETNEFSDSSARQGSTLAGYLYGYGYSKERWNASFNNGAVNLDTLDEIMLKDAKIIILSPDSKKLNRLSKLWLRKLIEIDKDFNISNEIIFDDAYEMYMKNAKLYIDTDENKDASFSSEIFKSIIKNKIYQGKTDITESNGSSISFILQYRNKKILFLGDSHEDIILDNIIKYSKDKGMIQFDAIKISHHGSLKNNFKWIERLKSNLYLISTNGKKHGHPNREVLAKILQHNDDKKTFYFNYPVDLSKEIDEKELKDEYKYSIISGDGESILEVEVNNK
ncbi:MBL fold metallo-hydrolase [Paraclostridium sordellii]|uniref:Zn-dependent hydrolase n=1 Tax=Paraclostridium sordellii TaxID=1505 RepID=A0A9P1KZG1_PARSO|nr:MBL fold metallo-hydrolase [Paeniclostridium sordellii]CEO33247.1 Zn-dependent hydrolase [[Clostridium] sordellii] [Paeniclostridium sordellii]